MKRRGFTLAEAFLIGQQGLYDSEPNPWGDFSPLWESIQAEAAVQKGDRLCRIR